MLPPHPGLPACLPAPSGQTAAATLQTIVTPLIALHCYHSHHVTLALSCCSIQIKIAVTLSKGFTPYFIELYRGKI